MDDMSTQAAVNAVPALTLGWRLQMALDHADVKVQEMADELGYARNSLSRWMHDEGEPRDVVVKQWALKCGVPYEWLRYGITPATGPDTGGDLQERTSRWKDDNVVSLRAKAGLTPHVSPDSAAA